MQTYDIVMIAVLAVATLFGAIKGFAWQIASLASIIVSYFVAYTFRNDVAKMIQAQEPWNGFLAMLLLFAGTSFAIWVVFRLISGTIDRVRLRDFDRHMGALLGLAKGVVYCMLITMFAVSLLGPKQQEAIVNSQSGGYISKMLAATDGIVWPKEIEKILKPYLDKMEKKFDQRGSMFAGETEQGGNGGLRQGSFGLPDGFGRTGSVPVSTPNWTEGWFPQRGNQEAPQQSLQQLNNPFSTQEFFPQ